MASLLATDAASARGAVADILGLVLQVLGALGFGYGIAIACDWRVALLVTGLLPLLVSGAVIQTRWAHNLSLAAWLDCMATAACKQCICTIHNIVMLHVPDSLPKGKLILSRPNVYKA